MKRSLLRNLDVFEKVDVQSLVTRPTSGICEQHQKSNTATDGISRLWCVCCCVLGGHRENGTVTLVCLLLGCVLVYREVQQYQTSTWISSITVDTRPIPEQHHISMGIDLTFPSMGCDGEPHQHSKQPPHRPQKEWQRKNHSHEHKQTLALTWRT